MTDFCIVLPPSPPPKFGAESINPGTNENKKRKNNAHYISYNKSFFGRLAVVAYISLRDNFKVLKGKRLLKQTPFMPCNTVSGVLYIFITHILKGLCGDCPIWKIIL